MSCYCEDLSGIMQCSELAGCNCKQVQMVFTRTASTAWRPICRWSTPMLWCWAVWVQHLLSVSCVRDIVYVVEVRLFSIHRWIAVIFIFYLEFLLLQSVKFSFLLMSLI